MTLAYFVLDGAAVWVGATMTHLFRGPWIALIAGGIFVAFGVASFLVDDTAEAAALDRLERARHLGPFFVSFLAIALSEMGDRTQLSFAALSARSPQSWLILAGGMAALALLNLLTVLVGKVLSERLRLSTIRKAGGAAFIAMGVATIAAALSHQMR
jgi:putative Ca2+/H+ antiporter (TMEM165/GDT1 family)